MNLYFELVEFAQVQWCFQSNLSVDLVELGFSMCSKKLQNGRLRHSLWGFEEKMTLYDWSLLVGQKQNVCRVSYLIGELSCSNPKCLYHAGATFFKNTFNPSSVWIKDVRTLKTKQSSDLRPSQMMNLIETWAYRLSIQQNNDVTVMVLEKQKSSNFITLSWV